MMAQMTIYIDNNLETKIKEMAQNMGMSMSKLISKILEKNISTHWNDDIKNFEGSWSDFPSIEEIRDTTILGNTPFQ